MKGWMQTWVFVDFTELADLICAGLEADPLQMVMVLHKPSEYSCVPGGTLKEKTVEIAQQYFKHVG